jgi:hypothetical protein
MKESEEVPAEETTVVEQAEKPAEAPAVTPEPLPFGKFHNCSPEPPAEKK